jgi:hypothetical protein
MSESASFWLAMIFSSSTLFIRSSSSASSSSLHTTQNSVPDPVTLWYGSGSFLQKIFILKLYFVPVAIIFSRLNTFMEKGKDPEPDPYW